MCERQPKVTLVHIRALRNETKFEWKATSILHLSFFRWTDRRCQICVCWGPWFQWHHLCNIEPEFVFGCSTSMSWTFVEKKKSNKTITHIEFNLYWIIQFGWVNNEPIYHDYYQFHETIHLVWKSRHHFHSHRSQVHCRLERKKITITVYYCYFDCSQTYKWCKMMSRNTQFILCTQKIEHTWNNSEYNVPFAFSVSWNWPLAVRIQLLDTLTNCLGWKIVSRALVSSGFLSTTGDNLVMTDAR